MITVFVTGLGVVCETPSERTAKAVAKHYTERVSLAGKQPVHKGRITRNFLDSVERWKERARSNPWGIEFATVSIFADNCEAQP